MKTKIQLTIIVLVLVILGAGAAIYKNRVLGFTFLPDTFKRAWTVEAVISFEADGGPVTISMNKPDQNTDMALLDAKNLARDYSLEDKDGRKIWKKDNAQGPQKIFFRATAYRKENKEKKVTTIPVETVLPSFEGALKEAADQVVGDAVDKGGSATDITIHLLTLLNSPDNDNTKYLLSQADQYGGKLNLARNLLQKAGIQSKATKGLWLDEGKKNQKLKGYLEVNDNNNWVLINQRTTEVESRTDFLAWQNNDESFLEITGGSGGKVRFSALSNKILAHRAAVAHGKYEKNALIDFSIYSLPIADQNTFKLLLLIPIGALIIVILRNLIGISTSGTFMPILIAMVLLQTSLLTGIGLFLIVVSIGLVLRSYLSHLNLLLVPRISAVLVFVIIIYVVISVISIKMGFEVGLQVTFFPMIIISWTIERMSILWEEEGPKDVFIQGGGSLFSASLIYLAMENKYIGHLTYSFPELLLVVLAVIIVIGSYSGYRLTELRRFEPLVKE